MAPGGARDPGQQTLVVADQHRAFALGESQEGGAATLASTAYFTADHAPGGPDRCCPTAADRA